MTRLSILRPFVSSCSIAAATAGFAECPVAETAPRGFMLTFEDGLVERHIPVLDDIVLVEGRDAGVVTHRLELLHGVYIQRYVEVQENAELSVTETRYVYPQGADAPQAPIIEARWSGTVTVQSANGETPELQVHEVGLPLELALPDCTTPALPVTIRYGEDQTYIETVHYLPELGIGYLQAYQNAGLDRNELSLVSIEAIP